MIGSNIKTVFRIFVRMGYYSCLRGIKKKLCKHNNKILYVFLLVYELDKNFKERDLTGYPSPRIMSCLLCYCVKKNYQLKWTKIIFHLRFSPIKFLTSKKIKRFEPQKVSTPFVFCITTLADSCLRPALPINLQAAENYGKVINSRRQGRYHEPIDSLAVSQSQ